MGANFPDTAALLEAVSELFETQLIANQDNGELKYLSRVSVNILNIVRREIELGEAAAQNEYDGLRDLLGMEGDVEELNGALCEHIRDGKFDDNAKDLMAHLRETILAKIAIDNPNYPSYRAYLEHRKLQVP